MTLPRKIINAICDNGGSIFEVGGAVRDEFLGITDHKDHDFLVTGIPQDTLVSLLGSFGKADLVGQSFGVIKLHIGGAVFDIALPRKEKSTGQGHKDFEVIIDHTLSVEDDLARRDFTMNATAINLSDKSIIDPFDGQKAIERKEIDIVFEDAFKDDPLRMLRAVQFAARLKFWLSDNTFNSIKEHAHLIKTISGERIFEEIVKIMERSEFPSRAFKLMKDTGLLEHLIPEFIPTIGIEQPNKFHSLDVFDHIMATLDSVPTLKLNIRLAALLHDIGKPDTLFIDSAGIPHFHSHEDVGADIAEKILLRWKAPKSLIENVCCLIREHMFELKFDITPKAIRRLLARVDKASIFDLLDLRMGDRIASGKPLLPMGKVGKFRALIDAELADPAFSIKDLKISGHDIIALGIKPGPKIGEILSRLLERVMDNPEINTKEQLFSIVQKEV